jgi:hypothetical protein
MYEPEKGFKWKRILKVIAVAVLLIISTRAECFYREGLEPQQWTVSLRIFPSAVNFPAADPDVQPVIQANTPVRIEITTWPPNRRWDLFIRAEGDLVNAEGAIISIAKVSWAATPKPPFIDGVLAAGRNILLANGRGDEQGELTLYFQNSWDYAAGEYTQVITFTASLI